MDAGPPWVQIPSPAIPTRDLFTEQILELSTRSSSSWLEFMEEIIKAQREFDKSKGWDWGNPESEKEKMDNLKYASIALSGEVGEFANIIKKLSREIEYNNGKIEEKNIENLREELIDIFIYTIKASIALDMDLKKEYYKKLKKNTKRFRRFEKEDQDD